MKRVVANNKNKKITNCCSARNLLPFYRNFPYFYSISVPTTMEFDLITHSTDDDRVECDKRAPEKEVKEFEEVKMSTCWLP